LLTREEEDKRIVDEYRQHQEGRALKAWNHLLKKTRRAERVAEKQRLEEERLQEQQQEQEQQEQEHQEQLHDFHERIQRERLADADTATLDRKRKLDSNPKFKISAKENELVKAKKQEWFDAGYSSGRIKKMLVKQKIGEPKLNRKKKLEETLDDRPGKTVTKHQAVKSALQSFGLQMYRGKVYDVYESEADDHTDDEVDNDLKKETIDDRYNQRL
jgi:hypothetical protein